jgi:hypothetical protein
VYKVMLICSKDVRHEHNTIVNLVAVLEAKKSGRSGAVCEEKNSYTCEGKYL